MEAVCTAPAISTVKRLKGLRAHKPGLFIGVRTLPDAAHKRKSALLGRTLIKHLVWGIRELPVPRRGDPSDGGEVELPVSFGAMTLVDRVSGDCGFKIGGLEALSLQNGKLVDRLGAN